MKHPIFDNMRKQMEPNELLLARTKAAVLAEKQKKHIPAAVKYAGAAAACLVIVSAAVWAAPHLQSSVSLQSIKTAYGTGADLSYAGILTEGDAGYETSLNGTMGILPGGCYVMRKGIGDELSRAMEDLDNDGAGFAVIIKPANLYSLYEKEMDGFIYNGKTVSEWEQLVGELELALKTDTVSDLGTAFSGAATQVSSQSTDPEADAADSPDTQKETFAPVSSQVASRAEDLDMEYYDTNKNMYAALAAQTKMGLSLLQEELKKQAIETEISEVYLTGVLTKEQIEAVEKMDGIYIGLAPDPSGISLDAVVDSAVSFVSSCFSEESCEAAVSCEPEGSGTADCQAVAPEKPFTREDAVKAAQSVVEETGNNDSILNFDDPDTETLTLPESYTVCDSIKEISRNIGGKTVWRVSFHTEQDALLGPITVYLDAQTGAFYGVDGRD